MGGVETLLMESAMLKFEKIESSEIVDIFHGLRRSKVPGGWLVILDENESRSLCFYPDPDHSWDGSSID